MGISMIPGQDVARKRLIRLLNRAAEVSETLNVRIDDTGLQRELKKLVVRLEEFIAYSNQKR